MKKKSYHFSIGNSAKGPLGLCAKFIATSKEEALERLKSHLPFSINLRCMPTELEYTVVYINTDAIKIKDITVVDEVEDYKPEEPIFDRIIESSVNIGNNDIEIQMLQAALQEALMHLTPLQEKDYKESKSVQDILNGTTSYQSLD